MDELTVQDAARLLHVSDKTMYRWIEQGKITARKYGIQHFISRQEVEALAKSRPVQLSDDHTRLDLLEQYSKTLSALFDAHDFRMKVLEQQIAELSQELHDLRIVYASKLLETPPEPPQTLYRFQVDKEEAERVHPPPLPSHPVKSTIPDGYVLVRYFNQLHGMKDTSIHRRIQEGIIEITRGEWQQGRTRVTQLLSPSQQRRYYLALHNYPGFVQCEHCPHE